MSARATSVSPPVLREALTVRRWSYQEWLGSEGIWAALMARAATDGLFLSWDWLTDWWESFGGILGNDPMILGCYRGAELVGIAPLYQRRLMRGGVVPTHSLQMMGFSWRDREPLISEYLDVIAAAEDLQPVREACVRALLAQSGWTEFVVGFTAAGSAWREAYGRCAGREPHYLRELDRSIAYQADLSGGFSAYLRELSQSTRRSLWNLRRRLGGPGEVMIETVGREQIGAAFEDLNRLHELRWQRPAFSGTRLAFHDRLAQRLIGRGELVISRLYVGRRVVSVLYDIRKGAHQYNIKMGFDPEFSTQISLGLIHLGYAMESAADASVTRYDFLAGPGRTSDFKRLLSQVRHELGCVQMLRGPILSALYRWRDRIR